MKRILKPLFRYFFKLLIFLVIITTGWTLIYRYLNPPFTPLMVLRYFQSDNKNKFVSKRWRDYDSISENMKLAIIAAEDQKFFEHKGFDLDSIKTAAINNMKGKRIKGASTISQQVAKNVFLWPSRTWLRKGLEIYFTLLLETFWSKNRILEVYLNIVEFGNGIYGVETASQFFFRKTSQNLTREEAALLTAVLPSPRRMSPFSNSLYLYKRKQWILQQMDNLGNIRYLVNGKVQWD